MTLEDQAIIEADRAERHQYEIDLTLVFLHFNAQSDRAHGTFDEIEAPAGVLEGK